MADIAAKKQSVDVRVGTWIINACIAIALAAAWSIERWPAFEYIALSAVILASVVSVSVLGVVHYRERKASSAAHQVAVAKEAQIASVKSMQLRPTLSAPSLYVLRRQAALVETNRLLAAYMHNLGISSAHEARHFNVEPTSGTYTVTIGVVRIEVDGDETKVTVKDNKKVTIEAPTAKSTRGPEEAITNAFLARSEPLH